MGHTRQQLHQRHRLHYLQILVGGIVLKTAHLMPGVVQGYALCVEELFISPSLKVRAAAS